MPLSEDKMNLYIEIDKNQIDLVNGNENTALVTVDLSAMWAVIIEKFTHIHLDVLVDFPILPAGKLQIEFSKDFPVKEIKDQKVEFSATYTEEDDTSRIPEGNAYLRGYQLS